eukprot:3901013-Prymnesium_polylepis.1
MKGLSELYSSVTVGKPLKLRRYRLLNLVITRPANSGTSSGALGRRDLVRPSRCSTMRADPAGVMSRVL